MNWKNRLTNYNFWISLCSAVLLILQAFNFKFDVAYISEIVTAILGLLVVIGIISDPTKTSVKQNSSERKKEQTDSQVSEKSDDIIAPIEKENEIALNTISNDIKAIFEKITQDLELKISELKKAEIINDKNNSEEKNISSTTEHDNENIISKSYSDISIDNTIDSFVSQESTNEITTNNEGITYNIVN